METNGRNDPFRDIRDNMDRLFNGFDSLINGWIKDFFPIETDVFHLSDEGTCYILRADLPGVPADHIQLSVRDGHLKVEVNQTRQDKLETGNQTALHSARCVQTRLFPLRNVKEEEITATFREGILIVSLPKQDPEWDPYRQINIKSS